MATIRPFSALRPSPSNAAKTAAVPYDVVSTDEARQLAAGNPLSFLHVSRAEIDLPNGTDPYSDAVYEKALENFDKLKSAAPLVMEESPSLYVYRLEMGSHRQTGITACCSLDEYDSDVIRKHERTRKDKEDDRTRHMVTLRAQTGPVFLTYRNRAEINRTVDGTTAAEPLYDLTAPDGVRHTIWRMGDISSRLTIEAFRSVPLIYIADGHHRAASASRARALLRSEPTAHQGDVEYNFFLSVIFPSDQVQILAYNRVVKDLNGMTGRELIAALSRRFTVSEAASPRPAKKGEISFYVEGAWYGLEVPSDTLSASDPIARLDASILHERVLSDVLEIRDVRTDKRVDFVGGVRGTEALEQLVNNGSAAAAFSMHPVTVEELIAVSDAGQIMPPKSTWFEPKLRDGLLIHVI